MGHDNHPNSSSSGTLVAVIGVGLVLAILAIFAVAGAGLFWVRASAQQAVVMEQQVVAELHRVGVEAQNEMARSQQEPSRSAATSDSRFNFVLKLDREGKISVDDETIGLDELKTRIATAKGESGNEFLVRIIADADCPVKHISPITTAFDDEGDIAWNMVSPENADAPIELNNIPS